MSLLNELYTMQIDPEDADEPSDKSYVDVAAKFAFEHDPEMVRYFQQMMAMPQFNAILEKQMTYAFRDSVLRFQREHDDTHRTTGQAWHDGYQGQTKVTFKQ